MDAFLLAAVSKFVDCPVFSSWKVTVYASILVAGCLIWHPDICTVGQCPQEAETLRAQVLVSRYTNTSRAATGPRQRHVLRGLRIFALSILYPFVHGVASLSPPRLWGLGLPRLACTNLTCQNSTTK